MGLGYCTNCNELSVAQKIYYSKKLRRKIHIEFCINKNCKGRMFGRSFRGRPDEAARFANCYGFMGDVDLKCV